MIRCLSLNINDCYIWNRELSNAVGHRLFQPTEQLLLLLLLLLLILCLFIDIYRANKTRIRFGRTFVSDETIIC
jgi:hypothetical protein